MSDFIDHPQYAKIVAFTQDIVQNISDLQNDFFLAHGYYFQGLWLLGDVEVNGTSDEDAVYDSHPYDQPYTWEDFGPDIFKANFKIPVNLKIEFYESPHGMGWILHAEIFYAGLDPDAFGTYGDHWCYRHKEGPADFSGIWDQWYILEEVDG